MASSTIEKHSELFSSMVELIPANYYVFKEEDFLQSNKYFHKKKTKAKPSKESKIKAKKARLDPSQIQSVQELKREAEEKREKEEEDDEQVDNRPISNSLKLNLERIESVPLSELRERLKAKIDECRSHRKVVPKVLQGNQNGARSGVENMKSKNKKDDKLADKKKKKKKQVIASELNSVKESKNIHQKKKDTIINDDSQVVFNKFDFTNPGEGNTITKKKKTKKESLKQLLDKAEEREKKLQQVTEDDPEKGQEMKKKIQWHHALKKAEGTREKSDPKLIKKTLKKEEKRKEKSRKKWAERTETQQQFKDRKQTKRQEHIRERIDTKKAKLAKSKAKIKKGRKKIIIRSS